MAKNNARIPDIQSLISAGIDPKTGLPIAFSSSLAARLKQDIKKLLRVRDEQDAINRFTWSNLPSGLSGQLLERILYYRGQGAFFYLESSGQFYFLPYALNGTIDMYGRFTGITPLAFNGKSETENEDGKKSEFITGLIKYPEYEVVDYSELEDDEVVKKLSDSCVLLSDYSNQLDQINISRQILMDPLLDVMSDIIPFARTSLLNSTGVKGIRVDTEDEASNVQAASAGIDAAARTGRKYIPIVGHVDFQDLTDGSHGADPEAFLLTLQSLDNFRLGMYGIENSGVFNRKGTTLQSQQDLNAGSTSLAMQDCLTIRQRFCDIVNSIWGLGISCERSENITMMDQNMDGLIGDEMDQSGTMEGEQPEGGAE